MEGERSRKMRYFGRAFGERDSGEDERKKEGTDGRKMTVQMLP